MSTRSEDIPRGRGLEAFMSARPHKRGLGREAGKAFKEMCDRRDADREAARKREVEEARRDYVMLQLRRAWREVRRWEAEALTSGYLKEDGPEATTEQEVA